LSRKEQEKEEINTENTETAESTEKKRTGEGNADAEKRQCGGDLKLP
jgi:hypothetical protein